MRGWRLLGTVVVLLNLMLLALYKWLPHLPRETLWLRRVHRSEGVFLAATARFLFSAGEDRQLVCLRAQGGEVLWRIPLPDLPTTSPTYSQGRLFLPLKGPRVLCLRAADGAPLWSASLKGEATQPVVAKGDRVYVVASQEGWLQALEVKEGKVLWEQPFPPPLLFPLLFEGERLLLRHRQRVFVVEAASGKVLQEIPCPEWLGPPPVVAEGMAFACQEGALMAFRFPQGTKVWEKALEGTLTRPTYADGRLFVASKEGRLFIVDAATGETQREMAFPALPLVGVPWAEEDGVYLASAKGHVLAVGLEPGRGP